MIVLCTTHHILFLLNQFSVNTDEIPLPSFAFLTVKSPSVTQRLVSPKTVFKKEQKPATFSQNYRLK